MLRSQDYSKGWAGPDEMHRVNSQLENQYRNARIRRDDLIMTVVGAGIGQVEIAPAWLDGAILSRSTARIAVDESQASRMFVKAALESPVGKRQILDSQKEGAQPVVSCRDLAKFFLPYPPPSEQRAIAETLSDVDALIGALDRLITKKRDLKQAAMQQLLTGQKRLPGFHGEWEVKRLGESADCLDQLRVPLNEAQRAQRKGDFPYCGANGVLDFVDGYVVDDDIILMAEDGGYFDEYETRPIAYRMIGKCWVNNHAHILKAKGGYDQGFLFYSLVHKNILPFLASGTRAKLNKSEMNKIEVSLPKEQPEQTAIAEMLSDMDAELAALEQRRDKTHALKQGMMQELLTGKTRLV